MRRATWCLCVAVLLFGCGKKQPDVVAEPQPEEMARDVVPACPDTETRRYVADTERCMVIRYVCAEGETPFSDDCGCGCERAP